MAVTSTHVCSWGISTTHMSAPSGAFAGNGIVYDFSNSIDAIAAPEQNEIGQIISQTVYDRRSTVNCTLQIAHGVTAPSQGQMVTINNINYLLQNITLAESNSAYARYTCTLEGYVGMTSVVAATGATGITTTPVM